jgi:hypothetical protein
VRQHDEAVTLLTLYGREEQQVGEREVGERLPRRDESLRVTE